MLTYWVGSPLTVEAEVEGAGELNLCITASLLPLSPSLSLFTCIHTLPYMCMRTACIGVRGLSTELRRGVTPHEHCQVVIRSG